MNMINLKIPVQKPQIQNLNIGDIVYLNGTIYTARDMGHLKMQEIINNSGKIPADLKNGVIFHAGPVVEKIDSGYKLIVIGPTTSIRMEPYTDFLGDLGIKIIIGKGGMGEGTLKSLEKHRMVYLQAPPGCAVVLGEKIEKIENVFWEELGVPEALWVLRAVKFGPLVVGMDSKGNSIYHTIRDNGEKLIEKMFS